MDKYRIILIIIGIILAIVGVVIFVNKQVDKHIMDCPGMVFEHYITHLDYVFDSNDDTYKEAVLDYNDNIDVVTLKAYMIDGTILEKNIDTDIVTKIGSLISECQVEYWSQRDDLVKEDGNNTQVFITFKDMTNCNVSHEEYSELYKDFFDRLKTIIITEIEED